MGSNKQEINKIKMCLQGYKLTGIRVHGVYNDSEGIHNSWLYYFSILGHMSQVQKE